MKKVLLLLIVFLQLQTTYAQYDNVWILALSRYDTVLRTTTPVGVTIDFNGSNGPTVLPDFPKGFRAQEAAANICDASGQLLFSTEGDTVWDRNRNRMPNGGGLTGIPSSMPGQNATYSASQGALIVPVINNPYQYYVFSLTDNAISVLYLGGRNGELYYSVVDMRLNNGLGDVVSGKKGIFMGSGYYNEAMAGVAGTNCNFWLVLSTYDTATNASRLYHAYEITEEGVNLTPVISDVGSGRAKAAAGNGDVGRIVFSPNGKNMVRTRAQQGKFPLQLFDFDGATGVVSNTVNLDTTTHVNGYLGASFSPDNSKLYAVKPSESAPGNNEGGLYQFDLSDTSQTAMINSKILVDRNWRTGWSDVRLAPDGKLYYNKLDDLFLKSITRPNRKGLLCKPEMTTLRMKNHNQDQYSNNFLNVLPILYPDTIYTTNDEIILCAKDGSLNLEAEDGFFLTEWEDGSTDSVRTITEAGTYWLKQANHCHYKMTTFIVKKIAPDPVITVDEFWLGTTEAFDTYQWLLNGNIIDGATERYYDVRENGDYTVIVTRNGCADTSALYRVENTSINDVSGSKATFTVYPNPAWDMLYVRGADVAKLKVFSLDGRTLKEADGTSVAVSGLAPGTYFLHIVGKDGAVMATTRFAKAE